MIEQAAVDYVEVGKIVGGIVVGALLAYGGHKALRRKPVDGSEPFDDKMRIKYLEDENSRLGHELEEAQRDANILGQAMLRIERLDERVKRIEGDDDCEPQTPVRRRR